MEKLFVGDGEVKVEGDVIDLETRLSVIQALIPCLQWGRGARAGRSRVAGPDSPRRQDAWGQ